MPTDNDSQYAPYSSAYDAVISWETDGVSDLDAAEAVARAIIDMGLHYSAGRYGRFVQDVAEAIEARDSEFSSGSPWTS